MNIGQSMSQPALRVDAIELAGLDECVANSRRLATSFRTQEQIVFSANGNGAHGAFGSIIIQLQKTMFQIRPHLRDARQGIADRARQWRFTGDMGELFREPAFKVIKDSF